MLGWKVACLVGRLHAWLEGCMLGWKGACLVGRVAYTKLYISIGCYSLTLLGMGPVWWQEGQIRERWGHAMEAGPPLRGQVSLLLQSEASTLSQPATGLASWSAPVCLPHLLQPACLTCGPFLK